MSLGVICGSVPHLPSLLRWVDFSRLASFSHSLLRTFKVKSKANSDLPLHDFNRVSSITSVPQKAKKETRVMGSIQG